MPSLRERGVVNKGGFLVDVEPVMRTSNTIKISFTLFLQGCAFLLESSLEGDKEDEWIVGMWSGGEETYALNFASSSANSWSTVRSICPVFCRS